MRESFAVLAPASQDIEESADDHIVFHDQTAVLAKHWPHLGEPNAHLGESNLGSLGEPLDLTHGLIHRTAGRGHEAPELTQRLS